VLEDSSAKPSEISSDRSSRRHAPQHPPTRQLLVMTAILSLSISLVALHLKAYRTFSPFDERQHVDYLYRVSRGELLRMGDRIGQDALRDEACRGLDWEFFTPPPCHPTKPYNPDIYPDLAYNSAHVHPPTYYLLTALAVNGFETTGLFRDFVTTGRLSGGLWLGLALLLFWHLAAQLQISRKNRTIAMILLATTPAVVHASSTINPDSTALFAGTALLLSTVLWERKRGRTILLLPVSAAFAVALKFTNILAVGASVLYLLFRWRFGRKRAQIDSEAGRGYLAAASVLTITGIGTAVIWTVAHNLLIRVSINPQLEQFQVESLSADAIVGQMMALVTPVRDAWLPPFLNNAAVKGILQLLNLGLLAAVFGAPLFDRRDRRRTVVAISGGLIILVSGTALTIANFYLNSGAYVAIPPRYGISVLPFLFVALASALRSPAPSRAAALLAVLSALTLLSGLLSAL
jgi:hypothetical protein